MEHEESAGNDKRKTSEEFQEFYEITHESSIARGAKAPRVQIQKAALAGGFLFELTTVSSSS